MKKIVSFLTIGLFLSIPFIANATHLGTGKLNVSWSGPRSGPPSPNYFDAASSRNNYVTSNWYYAQSPGAGETRGNFQDYLTPVPAPEPSTMLLLGTGLIGIAGLGRKKLFK